MKHFISGLAAACLLACVFVVSGCTTAQVATLNTDAAAVNAKVTSFSDIVTADCAEALAIKNSALGTIVNAAVPDVAQAASLVQASCGTAEAVNALAQSATSPAWLKTLETTIQTNGAVVPPAVAPAPVSTAGTFNTIVPSHASVAWLETLETTIQTNRGLAPAS